MKTNKLPKGETECICDLKPGGSIFVEDINNPVCLKCGKKLITKEVSGWEERFDKEFPNPCWADLSLHGLTTRYNAGTEIKQFISKLLAQERKKVAESIFEDLGEHVSKGNIDMIHISLGELKQKIHKGERVNKDLYKAIEEELASEFPNAGHIMGLFTQHNKEMVEKVKGLKEKLENMPCQDECIFIVLDDAIAILEGGSNYDPK